MKTNTLVNNRAEFGRKLKNHDWYYAYSDDHRSYSAGRRNEALLREMHKDFECPYSLATLRTWAHNMILEQFAEEKPDEWYRQPRKYMSVAPVKRADLITQAYHDEITQWMIFGASAEEISKLV